MPLDGNSIEIEPHFRVLTIGMNKFAEMLLHLTFKKDYQDYAFKMLKIWLSDIRLTSQYYFISNLETSLVLIIILSWQCYWVEKLWVFLKRLRHYINLSPVSTNNDKFNTVLEIWMTVLTLSVTIVM